MISPQRMGGQLFELKFHTISMPRIEWFRDMVLADIDPSHMRSRMHAQTDLFSDRDLTISSTEQPFPSQPRAKVLHSVGIKPSFDCEAAIQALEATKDYRVLRRLKPREIDAAYRPGLGESISLVVDVETTGLDHRHDEVIEIGMVAFVHDTQGRVGPVVGALSFLREPSIEITSEITRITGITPEMVLGKVLEHDAVRCLLERADLVIAHNAGFDRKFCERLQSDFCHKPWACSLKEVNWSELGFDGAKLGYLVAQNGWFHCGHRAVDDCYATLEVLAADLPGRLGPALGRLLDSSRRSRVRIWAERAPFDLKDVLKRRGYCWNAGDNGHPKAWVIEVDEGDLACEINFLRSEVYLRDVSLRKEMITAYDRYKAV